MTAERPFGMEEARAQATANSVTPAHNADVLPRHALNNILARIVALAEDLADHSEEEVARRGEAVIMQAELAARLLRGEA